MPVVDWVVRTGYTVEARDGEIGYVQEIFTGPPQSIFVPAEPYMLVAAEGQPNLFIPFTEIVDIGEAKRVVYLKRWLREINALRWTRDPRRPSMAAVRYRPRPAPAPVARAAVRVQTSSDGQEIVGPRPRGESGAWQPTEVAPRSEPGQAVRIGDRFQPGEPIPHEGQYMCTVCWTRKHTRQFREENPDGRLPPPHHPGALWELEDLRP